MMTEQNELDDLREMEEDFGTECMIEIKNEFERIKNFVKEERLKPKMVDKRVYTYRISHKKTTLL